MSARAKSPGRIACDNAAKVTRMFVGPRKIKHVLALGLPCLLIHGDDFINVFADFLTCPTGDSLLHLSADAHLALYTGSRKLSSEIGKLCVAQVFLMEKLWNSTKNTDRSKPFEDSVLKWLATPEVAKFVTVDQQIVKQFADFLILSESWKDAAKKLLGEPKNNIPLAMVQHLYGDGDTPADTDAGDQSSCLNKVEKLLDGLQNWANGPKKGEADDNDDSDEQDPVVEKKPDSPWHPTPTYILSWVWYIINWAPIMYMYCEGCNNLAAHAEQNLFQYCGFVHTAEFAEKVQKYLSHIPTAVAWISILWRKFMNARKPPEQRVSCTAPVVLLFFAALQNIVHVIPIIRCGLMTTDKTLKLLYVPTWVNLLVMMYCAEIIYCLVLRSRVQRDVTKPIQARHTPVFTMVVAFYTTMTFLDKTLHNPPFFRYIIVVSSVAMGVDRHVMAQHKDRHWNCQGTSVVLSRIFCVLLVTYEMGLCTVPDSVHPVLLMRVIDGVGNTHLELFAHFFVYMCIDFVWPAEEVEIDN